MDNAESLQTGPVAATADALGAWRPEALDLWPLLEGLGRAGLPVIISTRYAWPDLDPEYLFPIGPLVG